MGAVVSETVAPAPASDGLSATAFASGVRDHVLNELMSREAAERDYGIVLTDEGAVNEAATSGRRRGQI